MRVVEILGHRIETNASDEALELITRKWQDKTKSHTTKSLVNFIGLRPNLEAKFCKSDLPCSHIRNRVGVSNSYLTHLLYQLKGEAPQYPARALVFGKAFHELVLEPKQFAFEDYNLRASEEKALKQMSLSMLSNKIAYDWFVSAKKEETRQWIDRASGLMCKGKLDLNLDGVNIGDLKTTSARTQDEFIASLTRYDYDRQAAFYLSSSKIAKRFWFFGVQKRKPFHVFVVNYYLNSDFIRKGKKKFQFLISKCADTLHT